MIFGGYATPFDILNAEIRQLEYEGFIVSQVAKDAYAALKPGDAYDEKKISKVARMLAKSKRDMRFPYVQPNGLEEIRKVRPNGPRILKSEFNDDELFDHLHGAVTGRCVGCALGKPVENRKRDFIKENLQKVGHWPLDYYFSEKGDFGCPPSRRENIAYMEFDDDIQYTLIGLKVLESDKGPNFTWDHVAWTWGQSLHVNAIFTAERQALLNFHNYNPRGVMSPLTADFTSTHNNPCREWIGAQIRADGWAYCCAGNPELAAEFAWRDACWTHRANGIYGEMFAAAVIAAAFVEKDPAKLVEIGLSEIPANCRLAEEIRWALKTIPACPGFEDFMDRLDERFKDMDRIHTVNNMLIVVMSLFYGKMDLDKSACVSVMAGYDTDCNGATVGSIIGAAHGKAKLGGKLAEPLNDTIKTFVFGFPETITMTEIAQRCLKQWRRISEWEKAGRPA